MPVLDQEEGDHQGEHDADGDLADEHGPGHHRTVAGPQELVEGLPDLGAPAVCVGTGDVERAVIDQPLLDPVDAARDRGLQFICLVGDRPADAGDDRRRGQDEPEHRGRRSQRPRTSEPDEPAGDRPQSPRQQQSDTDRDHHHQHLTGQPERGRDRQPDREEPPRVPRCPVDAGVDPGRRELAPC